MIKNFLIITFLSGHYSCCFIDRFCSRLLYGRNADGQYLDLLFAHWTNSFYPVGIDHDPGECSDCRGEGDQYGFAQSGIYPEERIVAEA